MNMTELTILDELKTLLPPLSVEEFAGLEESILKDGCLSDLIAWGDILIDGHNRYEICRKHQIPFGIKSIHFESLDDAKFWIWKHQESRRNLTAYHRAEIALKLKEVIAVKARERQKGGQGGVLLSARLPEAKDTRQELAELAGIGSRTLDKAEYITEHADEETKAKLRRGEKGTSIHKEYNRIRNEQKRAEDNTAVTDAEPAHSALTGEPTAQENDSQPSHPNKGVKFVPHTTLKLIPQDSPHVLLVNLFEIFRKGFVEEMVIMAMAMLHEERGKETVKRILAKLNKQYGRK
jgi:hypothetical protein